VSEVIVIPRITAERIKREAEKLGVSVEEYLIELVSQNLDPRDKAKEYIEASKELLEQAKKELKKGDLRQAAEKIWGSAALAIKSYAYWKENKRLASHGELWEYSRIVASEVGSWVLDSWAHANSMHTCFYEGWCTKDHIEAALKSIEKLVETIAKKIARENT